MFGVQRSLGRVFTQRFIRVTSRNYSKITQEKVRYAGWASLCATLAGGCGAVYWNNKKTLDQFEEIYMLAKNDPGALKDERIFNFARRYDGYARALCLKKIGDAFFLSNEFERAEDMYLRAMVEYREKIGKRDFKTLLDCTLKLQECMSELSDREP